MKKIILFLFISGCAYAQTNCIPGTFATTPNLALKLPFYNQCNWGAQGYNVNFTAIDAMFPSGVLAKANGGTGTATPALIAGTNITITGTWPNQTINSTASAGGTWGSITGTLSGQTDLQTALNLKAALISPSFTTPNLGTPSAGVLTSATGLPLTTGVAGILPVANGGSGTATPAIVAGTNVTVSGTWPNQTVNSTGGGATNLTGPITSVGAATTVTGSGVISQKPDTTTAVEYAALKCAAGVACSDSNDGLTWGTAKLTIMAAYDALPAAGGEIRFADGVTANSVAGAGIWLMGGNDPNFASPPTGWRQIKTGNVSFVGVEQAGYTGLEHLGKSYIVAGSTADRNHPGIWLSATNITLHFSNLYVKYPGRGIVIGECSNHLRDQTCNSAGITFDNVAAATTGNLSQVAGTGPAWDFTGGSFWIYMNNCGANGTDQYNDPTGDLAPAILVDGRTNFGVGFVYIDKSNTSAGAIKFYEGANGGGLYVTDTTSENLHSPATVWFKTFTTSGDVANITNVTTADPETGGIITAVLTPGQGGSGYSNGDTGLVATGFGTAKYTVTGVSSGAVTTFTFTTGGGYSVASGVATTVTTGGGNAAFQVNITSVQGTQYDVLNSDLSVVGAANLTVSNASAGGPIHSVAGSMIPTAFTVNPLAQQQVGVFNGRELGQDDNARRGFSPVAIRFTNNATLAASGTGLTAGVAAPDGTTGAITVAAGGDPTFFADIAYTAVVGDWWVGGMWVKGIPGFGQSIRPAKLEFVGASGLFTGRNVASGNVSYCQPPWAGNGEWQWCWIVAKVTATDSTLHELKFVSTTDGSNGTSYYGPVLFKIANGTVSDNEAWEIAANLQSYASTCAVGTLCGLSGQKLHEDALQVTETTVAALGTCNAAAAGSFKAVSDAAATPVYNATVASGGSVHIPVYCNGTNWTNH